MTKYFIYRTSHTEGFQPLSVEYSYSAADAVARFVARDEATGEFVAELKCRPIHWWLY